MLNNRLFLALTFLLSLAQVRNAAAAEPTVPASNLTLFNSICNELDIVWAAGDGGNHLVVISTNPISSLPVDGVGYIASQVYGSGSNLGNGTYVVSSNSGTNITVIGLATGITYYVAVFEYNGTGISADYLTSVYPSSSAIVTGTGVTASSSSSTICTGDSTLLTAVPEPGSTVIWSPTFSTANSFAVYPATTTTYVVTSTAPNGCTASASVQVTVNQRPVVSLAPLTDVCINSPAITLTGGTPAGGVYSGAHVVAGLFSPSAAGVGPDTINYSFTSPQGCTNTATGYITVNPLPTVTLAAFNPICANAAPFLLSGGNPAGGTYTGPGVMNDSLFPAMAGTGNKTITYTYFAPNGCSNTTTANQLILALPAVTFSTIPGVCPESSPFNLAGGSPVGGVYAGPGVSAGMFNPTVTGSGTFIIDYTYQDGNGCSNTAVQSLTVYAPPVVNFTPPASLCSNGSPVLLTGGTPSGGSYQSPYVNAGRFNPVLSGAGQFPVVYFFTDANSCESSDTGIVVVNAPPVVDFATPPSVCINSFPLQLNTGTPSGGTYSGPAVVNNTFQPALADTGSIMLYYNYTDANGCSSSDSASIRVNPLPVVVLSALAPRCVNAGPLQLSGGTPVGGAYTGSGVSGSTFYTAIAGVGTHAIIYTYTNPANGCVNRDTQNIVVNPVPVVNLGADTTLCAGFSVLLNAGNPGSSYQWSTGATTQTLTIDTTGRGLGTFDIRVTVTNTFTCFARDTVRITFTPCAGIDSPVSNDLFACYPNPFGQHAVLQLKSGGTVWCMDAQGRTVFTATLPAGNHSIGEEWASGLYLLRVMSADESATFRLIKQ